MAKELPAGSVGTVQPDSGPRFSTEPSGTTLPPEVDELLEEELLEDEELLLDEDELLEDEELVLDDELLLEELLLDDEVLELVPPQAAIAAVNKAMEQHCKARLVRGVMFCTGVLLMNYCR